METYVTAILRHSLVKQDHSKERLENYQSLVGSMRVQECIRCPPEGCVRLFSTKPGKWGSYGLCDREWRG